MKEFKISLPNRPGELANLSELLSRHEVSMESIAGITEANKAVVIVVTDDVAKTRDALKSDRVQFEEVEVLIVDLEDRPGELAKVARKLGGAKVNIESVYLLGKEAGKYQVALEVDKLKVAKDILG